MTGKMVELTTEELKAVTGGARTKQTARKSTGGKAAPRKLAKKEETAKRARA